MKIPLKLKQLYWDYKWAEALPSDPDFFIEIVRAVLKHDKNLDKEVNIRINKDGTFNLKFLDVHPPR